MVWGGGGWGGGSEYASVAHMECVLLETKLFLRNFSKILPKTSGIFNFENFTQRLINNLTIFFYFLLSLLLSLHCLFLDG